MVSLAWTLSRATGWSRGILLAACTALVSGLLLVAVALLLLHGDVKDHLISVVADDGTRGGVVLAVVLLAIPPLLLLDQAVRLGTASRQRRFAALRVAGATPSEVRRLGAIEVGIPSTVGAVLGVLVYSLLRATLGSGQLGVVPSSVTPAWWQILAVVFAVSVLGIAVGWRASTSVIETPLNVTRRQRQNPPRLWGLVLIATAAALTPIAFAASHSTDVLAFVAVGLVVLGVSALAPWVAYRVASFTQARASSPATLLAAQRIIAEPRAAGRAAAAVGGIALVGGGNAGFLATVLEPDYFESFHVINSGLVTIALVAGLLVTTGSMAVHSVESLLDRRREVAFLAATGVPASELDRAQRREMLIVALPLAVLGATVGAVVVGGLGGAWSGLGLPIIVAGVALTVALVWIAAIGAVRAVRPWARRAALPANLRTE